MDNIYTDLVANFPDLDIKKDFPLAPLTTLNIGGPADIFIQTQTNLQLIDLLKHISEYRSNVFLDTESSEVLYRGREYPKKSLQGIQKNIPITILGNGSNVLISDSGIRGIVIKNLSNQIDVLNPIIQSETPKSASISTRRNEQDKTKYLDFASLNYDESDQPKIEVKLDAGVPLPLAISKLLDLSITGLQWFAYIPGTIGGATWYNIHGGSYHFSQYVKSVEVYNKTTQKIEILDSSQIDWGYDSSTFQTNLDLIILSITLSLYQGDSDKAKQVVKAWITQKSKVQPLNSAGSVFQNPDQTTAKKIWGEPKSTGWIIDQELGLKGTTIGGAQISPLHANFIVNTGKATAKDFMALVSLIQTKCQQKFNWQPELEITLLGDFK